MRKPSSPSEELEKSAAVFAGRVVSVRHSYDPDAVSHSPEDRTTVRFEVSTVWKGAVNESMYVTTPPTGGSCGFTFIEGEGVHRLWSRQQLWRRRLYRWAYAVGQPSSGKRKLTSTRWGKAMLLKPERADRRPAQPLDMRVRMVCVVILTWHTLVVVVVGIVVYSGLRRR